jgi:hypothetical protein
MPDMRITLSLNGHKIGYIDYQLINVPQKMGLLGTVFVQPTPLLNVLTKKIKQNTDIAVRGGFTPPDLSQYFDGIFQVLDRMRDEIEGFDFQIPPESDPYLEDVPEDVKQEIH